MDAKLIIGFLIFNVFAYGVMLMLMTIIESD